MKAIVKTGPAITGPAGPLAMSMLHILNSQAGWTALHLAAQGGKVGVVRLLTEAEAQVNMQTEVYTLFKITYTIRVSISFL